MNKISKVLIGSAAAAAVTVSGAAPALARDRHGDGIDAGDIIAGALIIGGIAAIASATRDGRDGRYDPYERGYDRGYERDGYGDSWRYGDRYYDRGNPRDAVERCVRAAERSASRYSYGNADVTDIRDIRRTGRGFEIRGRIAVNAMGRDWRDGDRWYGRGWNGDYRGWDSRYRGYDAGGFKCRVEYGRVVDLDFNGIRGL